MKRKPISILLSLLLLAVIGSAGVSIPVTASRVGAWKGTTNYPTNIYEQSCVYSAGYIYCVAGYTSSAGATSAVYFAPLSNTGIGTWTKTTSYPISIYAQSCVVSGGYIFCVGGYTGSAYTNAVYYASLSSSGVGVWKSTTSYSVNLFLTSCVVGAGYIYCVGGGNGDPFSAVYFAKLSSSGVGTWTKTASYPTNIYAQSCVASGGYIYCVAGQYTPMNPLATAVYFARLSSSGVGAWTQTTSYPTTIEEQSCVVRRSYIYCVAGFTGSAGATNVVYFASLSSSGVGVWTKTRSYPVSIYGQSCVMRAGYVYCIGGNTGSSLSVTPINAEYFASV